MIKRIEVFKDSDDCLDGLLVEVIALLQSKLDLVPDEFKDIAIIDVEGAEGYGVSVEIHYARDYTLDEVNEYEQAEREKQRDQVERAKNAWLRLKDEYGLED